MINLFNHWFSVRPIQIRAIGVAAFLFLTLQQLPFQADDFVFPSLLFTSAGPLIGLGLVIYSFIEKRISIFKIFKMSPYKAVTMVENALNANGISHTKKRDGGVMRFLLNDETAILVSNLNEHRQYDKSVNIQIKVVDLKNPTVESIKNGINHAYEKQAF